MRRPRKPGAWGARRGLMGLGLCLATSACFGWGIPDVAHQPLPGGDPAVGGDPGGDSEVQPCGGCPVCQTCDGQACNPIDDGTPCPPQAAGVGPSLCVGGSCVVSACGDSLVDARLSEQCDGTSDCLSSCRLRCQATDCNDYNPCNGLETCDGVTGLCVAGTGVICRPFGACSGPVCVPVTETTWVCACP